MKTIESVTQSALYKKYSNLEPNTNTTSENYYKKDFIYKNQELQDKMNAVQKMNIMDDNSLETIHSHGAGFHNNNYNWIFTFITNEYKAKYPELTENPSIWEWLCFSLLILIIKGEETLKSFKSSTYTGINVQTGNAISRKRLAIGTIPINVIVKSRNHMPHPFENHEFYKKNKMIFNIGKAIEFIIPSIFSPLKAVHSRSMQKISSGSIDDLMQCIKVEVTPGFVVNFKNVNVNGFNFMNYECNELIEYAESLVNNDLKLTHGLKIGTRKTKGRQMDLVAVDDHQKTATLNYCVIKTLIFYVDNSKSEPFLSLRSYDDHKITVGNNVLLSNEEMDLIIANFDKQESIRYSQELDNYAESIKLQNKNNDESKEDNRGAADDDDDDDKESSVKMQRTG